ncbi:thiamine-phosphate kinase [Chelatococcus sp. SYSU_G07232]|uniref:Thiamine-monophosphate kinase n=1 Tax=Chelatococcus albus TaxID=3047466 RepID=A0ABT7AC37_9HYPH|nr:thiamine-phosphate kinase [Chelatococcus sp. SYSU_G07232]MDJ1156930.1 thiamine-phosphate kinase [Chelatococcus sp. SYSU_G07232]
MTSGERLSEDELIARLFAPIAGAGAFSLKDDAARLQPPEGQDLVLTADALVAGVHFFATDPAGSVARKALRVNLSDLAAKGADPLGFLITVALPPDWTVDWLAAFAAALGEDAHRYHCPLLGGDTVRTPGPLTLSVTAFGALPTGRMVTRLGARPGDRILVTGTIGDASLGLALRSEPTSAWANVLSPAEKAHLADRYLQPEPRCLFARAIRDHANAAMDVSDGLVGDLAKLLKASGVSGELDLDAVPLSAAARAAIGARPQLLETAVTGGDDYEILCTVPEGRLTSLRAAADAAGVALSVIGEVQAGKGELAIRDQRGPRQFGRQSFSHF